MSICEKEMTHIPPVIVTFLLFPNAFGRVAVTRLGMSRHHFMWIRITFKSDVTGIKERGTTTGCSECFEFGQV